MDLSAVHAGLDTLRANPMRTMLSTLGVMVVVFLLNPPSRKASAMSALLVGLVFGTYPAIRASRLAPIDAIQRE